MNFFVLEIYFLDGRRKSEKIDAIGAVNERVKDVLISGIQYKQGPTTYIYPAWFKRSPTAWLIKNKAISSWSRFRTLPVGFKYLISL
jgi:hypothetical protein